MVGWEPNASVRHQTNHSPCMESVDAAQQQRGTVGSFHPGWLAFFPPTRRSTRDVSAFCRFTPPCGLIRRLEVCRLGHNYHFLWISFFVWLEQCFGKCMMTMIMTTMGDGFDDARETIALVVLERAKTKAALQRSAATGAVAAAGGLEPALGSVCVAPANILRGSCLRSVLGIGRIAGEPAGPSPHRGRVQRQWLICC